MTMKIQPMKVTVKEVFNGYKDSGDDGVVAYGGKLNIRPAYQREYVYEQDRAEAVIHTAIQSFPLNVMYWVKIGENQYEILDGQQRTLSLMRFLDHKFDIEWKDHRYYWDSLPDDLYKILMDYPLMVYCCEGTTSEKLDWFRVVNVPGLKLTDQELRNSVYTGPWLSNAKYHFSKRGCAAEGLGDKYVKGDPNRQELLEVALDWISESQGMDIDGYMTKHQHDSDADELWQYYQDVIAWVKKIFPKYYADMKGQRWGHFYHLYHTKTFNSTFMGSEEDRLQEDEEVEKKSGIYEFLLCRDTDVYAGRLLNLRSFEEKDKKTAYASQKGICAICHKHFAYNEMEGDHIKPWSKGGLTEPSNLQMICKDCNGKKSDKY